MTDPALTAPVPPRTRTWIMPMLVGINLLVVLGIGGYLVFMQRNVAHARPAAEHAPAHAEVHFGPIVEVEPMLTNLNDPSGEHYIKMTVRIEVANEAAVAQVESGIVPIRDRYLSFMSGLALADTVGPAKQAAMRRTLKSLANEVLGRPLVRRVYLSEFVIQ